MTDYQNDPMFRDAWRAGAHAEASAIREGMTKDNTQIYNFVHILAQQGRSKREIARVTTLVFTCEWPLIDRLCLAWKVIRK